MTDIFVSYTASDRQKAFWIGQELEKLGHRARLHDWELSAGGNIPKWMGERHHDADHILLVVSKAYLTAPYSNWERQAAEWAAADKRPNFALPVFIEECEAPTLSAIIKRCDLFGLTEEEARARLKDYLTPAAKPSEPVPYFGAASSGTAKMRTPPDRIHVQPGSYYAVSNIPIAVPRHFVGRDDVLADIKTQLAKDQGRVSITALHGLRGVGKTTLAAAYADKHRADYRATWWVRAQTPEGTRADLVALGVRLGWIASDEKEGPAVAIVTERLRHEGEDILLIFDNANNPGELRPYLPVSGSAQIIVTSNAPNWGSVAAPVQIKVWPKDIGADFFLSRVLGRTNERAAAEELSAALGGLPLAHEQAAAFCERLGISFAAYLKRFEATPATLLDAAKDAPAEYHDRMTVTKTFALAIDEAAKLHSAAEPLIVYAALLAPEPIPLFLFSEGRGEFGEPLASALAGDGLDEAVAALRAFALVDRESVADERDPAITTDCIRLHRLVRQVTTARRDGKAQEQSFGVLIAAVAAVYPNGVFNEPKTWPRARRLDSFALALVGGPAVLPKGAETRAADLLVLTGQYMEYALAAYATARTLFERALAIYEKVLGPENSRTAACIANLAHLTQTQGNFAEARPLYERALAVYEKMYGSEHPETATSLSNLADLLQDQGDLVGARSLCERALQIREKVLGSQHPETANSVNNLAVLLRTGGDLPGARRLYERALAIYEKLLGPEHVQTAVGLANLADTVKEQGDLRAARSLYERALAIDEKVLGPEHPGTATTLIHFGDLLRVEGNPAGALPMFRRALAIFEKALGPGHPRAKTAAQRTADTLLALSGNDEIKALQEKYGI